MKKNIFWSVLIVLGIITILVTKSVINLYIQWLWFQEINMTSVFLKVLYSKISLGIIGGIICFIFLLLNQIISEKLSKQEFVAIGDILDFPTIDMILPYIRIIFFAVSAFLSAILAIEISSKWDLVLKFIHKTPFDLKDPIFGKNVSFFIFDLPLYKYIYNVFITLITFSIILSLSIYFVRRLIKVTNKGLFLSKVIYSHMSVLLSLFMLAKCYGYYISQYGLLFANKEIMYGAGYADIAVKLPLLKILFILSAVGCFIFFINAFIRSWKLPSFFIILIIVVSVIGGTFFPEIIQKLKVAPNEITVEKPYINNHIKFTRIAYDLDKIKIKPFPVEEKLTYKDIENNNSTISNIRLWDHRPLLDTFGQLQGIRTYYKFINVDIDRYQLNGNYSQVALSARELSYDFLPSKIWINEHLTYTHGYGLCLTPVNIITKEGLPRFLIKDIPPQNFTNIKLTKPEIYFGELSNEYVFVNTNAKEFDYPSGAENKYCSYQGKGGIKISSFLRRIPFAIHFSSLPIIFNRDINKNSKILIKRTIKDRIKSAFPFFAYDEDPYLVLADGKLKWIIDGYTFSDMFPYSEPIGHYNYIRNPIKCVIDAYDGTIDFYVIDSKDPIMQTYIKIFPDIFKTFSQMSDELKSHIRYPLDLFKIQSAIFRTYHMLDSQVFYNKEDLWEFPEEIFFEEKEPMPPYYMIMKLPEEEKEEFILMLPFTPRDKDNLSSWLCARNDGKNYGELILYSFPKQKLIFGPMQIEARIDQDTNISRELSLWGQKGSQVIRGNTLVIPIEKSLIYVEPLFLRAEKGQIPELKRVIVAFGEKLVMEENLEIALKKLFASTSPEDEYSTNEPQMISEQQTYKDLINKALSKFYSAKEKIKVDDWASYGKEINEVGEILEMLNHKAKAKEEKQENEK